MMRVTPGVEVHTHEFVLTGQEDSKFGFGWHSGAAEAAVRRARASSSVDLVGLHMHIGSQVFVAENFGQRGRDRRAAGPRARAARVVRRRGPRRGLRGGRGGADDHGVGDGGEGRVRGVGHRGPRHRRAGSSDRGPGRE